MNSGSHPLHAMQWARKFATWIFWIDYARSFTQCTVFGPHILVHTWEEFDVPRTWHISRKFQHALFRSPFVGLLHLWSSGVTQRAYLEPENTTGTPCLLAMLWATLYVYGTIISFAVSAAATFIFYFFIFSPLKNVHSRRGTDWKQQVNLIYKLCCIACGHDFERADCRH